MKLKIYKLRHEQTNGKEDQDVLVAWIELNKLAHEAKVFNKEIWGKYER